MYYYQLRATVLDVLQTEYRSNYTSRLNEVFGSDGRVFNRNNFASRMITRNQWAGTECLQQKAAAAVLY